ncbi:MAG TPA: acetyl-CoA carboxylase biotin carboxyl carrier protein [Bryobacteraceae bacterium]|nr:acetyl-CoA carboxylase biotin carboxyl carrier protein [Bryobacteraceae bacterium]
MSNDEIRELVQLVIESGVAEIEVQRGENRVRIKRTVGGRHEVSIPPSMMSPPHTPPMPETIVQTVATPPTPTGNETIVKSPIVGTYYDAPKPGDPPFVKVGDSVEPGQVLCIIESMKLMNEIESESAGTVVAKLMENGRAVEYGEALFTIRPR